MNLVKTRILAEFNNKQSDFSKIIDSRLINLNFSDNTSLKADSLTLSLDDHDHFLEIPRRGAKLKFYLEYLKIEFFKGEFKVVEVSHSSPPDILEISAVSSDFLSSIKNRTTRSFNNKKLAELIKLFALENNLKLKISDEFNNIVLPQIDMQDRSVTDLLNEFAQDYNAFLAVKNNTLIFLNKEDCLKSVEQKTINRKNVASYNFSIDEAEQYDNVITYYHDYKSGKKEKVTTKVDYKEDFNNKNSKVIKRIFDNKELAEKSGLMQARKLKQQSYKLTLNLSHPAPDLIAGQSIKLKNFKKEINEKTWFIDSLNLNLDRSGGLQTSLNLISD